MSNFNSLKVAFYPCFLAVTESVEADNWHEQSFNYIYEPKIVHFATCLKLKFLTSQGEKVC